ncbi:uncharacterized protein B0H18DRAFT_220559 [Fomitopsis serialis]|uniref:uncharacterized protein n=1 Tax=Fomitopsis serialis TaxID=139415 RepID=UPI002007EA48|nr:uncharacterized protein B0H18DRAFT_220559 [Neoantrodia serialis]KAH9929171.1 hypothetical protein B0H18DRAFT_220559 [Neoantrodia serialis]
MFGCRSTEHAEMFISWVNYKLIYMSRAYVLHRRSEREHSTTPKQAARNRTRTTNCLARDPTSMADTCRMRTSVDGNLPKQLQSKSILQRGTCKWTSAHRFQRSTLDLRTVARLFDCACARSFFFFEWRARQRTATRRSLVSSRGKMHLRTNSREREQCGTQDRHRTNASSSSLGGGGALVRLPYPLKTPVPSVVGSGPPTASENRRA